MSTLFQSLTNAVKHWYIPLIFGVIFLVFGFYIFTVPLETYVTLSVLFSVTFLVSGISEIFFSLQNTKSLHGWGWFLVDGLLSTAIGIYLLSYPTVSMAVLPFVVGFTLLFRSFQLLGFSFDMKDLKLVNWGNVAITSVIGIIFSILLLASPFATGISLVTLTACAFIFIGISSIVLSFNLKKLKNAPEKVSAELKNKIKELQKEVEAVVKSK